MSKITRTGGNTDITAMVIATNSPTTIYMYIAFTPPSTGTTVIDTDTLLVELEVTVDTHTIT